MKKRYNKCLLLFVFTLFLTGCSDNETYIQGVTGIELVGVEGNVINIIEQDTYDLKVKVNPENADNFSKYATFNYKSGNEDIFTVDNDGIVTALSPGEAILTISAQEDTSIRLISIVKVAKRLFPVTSIETGNLRESLFIEGMRLNLADYIKILPENATNAALHITSSDERVAAFDKDNSMELQLLVSGKVTICMQATDGSGVEKAVELNIISKDAEIDFTSLERSQWEITPSHDPVQDNSIGGNMPGYLFDNNKSTGLSLYKPGKKGIPKEDTFGFTIELPVPTSINAFRLTHRKFGYNRLSPYTIDLLGSNDGENFTLIQNGIPTLYIAGSSDVEVTRILPSGSTLEYKFIKVIYSNYDSANGDTVQVMEFELGTGILQENDIE